MDLFTPSFRWDVYRVKSVFALGNVTWPVGAIRFWTDLDLAAFKSQLQDTFSFSPEAADFFVEENFEKVHSGTQT